ncbi:MAG: BamA/TamA family outer membrane protein [Bacteroidales bacterium]
MIRSSLNKYAFILLCLFLASCSGIKYVPKGDKLYTGAEVKLESPGKIGKKKARLIKAIAKDAIRPKPNKVYLGIRPKIWLDGLAGADPKGKFKKWLKKTGEAPVLMSTIKPGVTAAIIDAKIFNIGIFKGYTGFKVVEKKNTAKVIYTSHVHEPYKVKDLQYAISDDSLSRLILSDKEKSIIKPEADYNLNALKAERIRIDALLKNNGYFYFSPDFLLFKADTSAADHSVSLTLTLKDSVPQNALSIYRINHVFIDQEHSLSTDSAESRRVILMYDDVAFAIKDSTFNIRPGTILRSVYLRKYEIYSRQNHNITLNRLMSMGNFKFIQVKFSDSDTTAPGYLDVDILMTPMSKYNFRAEIELVSKSNSYLGPRMNLSVLNRNTFRGAEFMNINMAGSFEAQLGGAVKNQYSYSWNPQVELFFPLFLVPFHMKNSKSIYIPKTRISLSYNYLKRVNYFDMSTFQFVYGYSWKKDIRIEYELNPINVSYTTIGNKSAKFIDLLASNPYLKKSYEEQFIAGGSYSFTYNEQVLPGKKIQYFLHLTSEVAGNAFSLVKVIAGNKISSDNPTKIAGAIYSQFAKLSVDGRVYYNFPSKDKLALRIFAGLARPYGNSSILPYNKQFFSGGPNSIRAFLINSLGPGSYHQLVDNTGFLQLGGDVKLEMNAEFRFTIYRFLKGALFTDAGNVWLLKSNPSTTGTPFSFSGFSGDIAVGAGVGLRMDVSFFILRFDLATPLRKPWLDKGNRWVTNQIAFGDPAWRKENLIFNIAIGYPF